jgi:hypothetical protein
MCFRGGDTKYCSLLRHFFLVKDQAAEQCERFFVKEVWKTNENDIKEIFDYYNKNIGLKHEGKKIFPIQDL